jgi:hypothetical protein
MEHHEKPHVSTLQKRTRLDVIGVTILTQDSAVKDKPLTGVWTSSIQNFEVRLTPSLLENNRN